MAYPWLCFPHKPFLCTPASLDLLAVLLLPLYQSALFIFSVTYFSLPSDSQLFLITVLIVLYTIQFQLHSLSQYIPCVLSFSWLLYPLLSLICLSCILPPKWSLFRLSSHLTNVQFWIFLIFTPFSFCVFLPSGVSFLPLVFSFVLCLTIKQFYTISLWYVICLLTHIAFIITSAPKNLTLTNL